MANHASAKKRIRQSEKKRVHNRYYAKTMRNALKSFRESEDKKEIEAQAPKLVSLIDKVAKKNIIHKNKAANLKSQVMSKASSVK